MIHDLAQTPSTAFDTASNQAPWRERIALACDQACDAIAPSWPLDRSIAVNPHWKRIGQPLRRVAARMAVLGGIDVFAPRERQLAAWHSGRITPADLDEALHRMPGAGAAGWTPRACVEALGRRRDLPRLPLLIDVLDDDPRRHRRLSWRQAITHQVSQTCAAYFDRHQADWQPARGRGLYAFWRETLRHDRGIGHLMGSLNLVAGLGALADSAEEAPGRLIGRLELPETAWADYLEAVLLTVNGWASWCAYVSWQAKLEGRDDGHLRELLAIRLSWGALLLGCKDDLAHRGAFAALTAQWKTGAARIAQAEDALFVDEVWQLALDIGFQRGLARRLRCARAPGSSTGPFDVQAAFCIDVRSEPLRHALESVHPALRTIGIAGFFGIPAAYTPMGTAARRPQLPGLLAPSVEASDRIEPGMPHDQVDAIRTRRRRFAAGIPKDALTRWPGAAFSFVESLGIAELPALFSWLLPSAGRRVDEDQAGLPARYRMLCRPRIVDVDPVARTTLAREVLRAMGLTSSFAPLVLLVAHASQSANNAHAAALDCGACCGQSGAVNVRMLSQLVNDPDVRDGLRAEGIDIPDETVFVAALHNTTTDEVDGLDLDLLPPRAALRWRTLRETLDQAGDRVRRQRAPALGLDDGASSTALRAAFRRRANDGAQTRPEWGLAGNAAFVIAPRVRTHGTPLDGRCFLHDYDPDTDVQGARLETVMTGPLVVTHWINAQYHASTCAPDHLGSGNKLLHNVVGGHLGVFEGNGGDLRIGLPRQSLHDGLRWIHEPVRLTVVIDAPAARIKDIVARHRPLDDLVSRGWLHLWRFEGDLLERLDGGEFLPIE